MIDNQEPDDTTLVAALAALRRPAHMPDNFSDRVVRAIRANRVASIDARPVSPLRYMLAAAAVTLIFISGIVVGRVTGSTQARNAAPSVANTEIITQPASARAEVWF